VEEEVEVTDLNPCSKGSSWLEETSWKEDSTKDSNWLEDWSQQEDS